MRRFYNGGVNKVGLAFDYLKIETGEGASGVYHVLYFGDFIPQRWLSDQWGDIIGARVVDIRATRRGGVKYEEIGGILHRAILCGSERVCEVFMVAELGVQGVRESMGVA